MCQCSEESGAFMREIRLLDVHRTMSGSQTETTDGGEREKAMKGKDVMRLSGEGLA